MASEHDDTVFPDEDIDDDEESLEDDEDDDDEEELNDDVDDVNSVSPSTSSAGPVPVNDASAAVTVAVPGIGVHNGELPVATSATTIVATSISDQKRQLSESVSAGPLIVHEEKKPLDESRKLFQRLWTDEDEIELLQGFLDYTAQRGTTHHHQNDTALFYDQIKSKLQLDFNKNQLVEKLRRLKKKYRNVLNKISSGKEVNFKSAHDQATFEISRKIWSNSGRIGVDDNALDDDDPNPNPNSNNGDTRNEEITGNSAERKAVTTPRSRKRARSRSGLRMEDARAPVENSNKEKFSGHANNNVNNISGLIEETVRSCLSPLFKEFLTGAIGGPFGARGFSELALNPIPLSFGGGSMNFGRAGEIVDERWRKQQILELEVYSKRLELVQDQIKSALQELRSTGG